MSLATAPDCILACGKRHEHYATDIELWKAHGHHQLASHYVVSYKHVTESLVDRKRNLVYTTGGAAWAYVSKERPPDGALQKLVQRSFLIGRTLMDCDVVDLLRPYKLAEVLTR